MEEKKSDEYSNNMTEAMGAGKLIGPYINTLLFEGNFFVTLV